MTSPGSRPEMRIESGDHGRENKPVPHQLIDDLADYEARVALAEERRVGSRARAVFDSLIREREQIQDSFNLGNATDIRNRMERLLELERIYTELRDAIRGDIRTPDVLGRIIFLERALEIKKVTLRTDAEPKSTTRGGGLDLEGLPVSEVDPLAQLDEFKVTEIQGRWEQVRVKMEDFADAAEQDMLQGLGQITDEERLLYHMIARQYQGVITTDATSETVLALVEKVLNIQTSGPLRFNSRGGDSYNPSRSGPSRGGIATGA